MDIKSQIITFLAQHFQDNSGNRLTPALSSGILLLLDRALPDGQFLTTAEIAALKPLLDNSTEEPEATAKGVLERLYPRA